MIQVTFQGETLRDIYRQIAEFLAASDAPSPKADKRGHSEAEQAAKEAESAVWDGPTPAVRDELIKLEIPKAEWPKIPRTGKGGRLTKGDVRKYAKSRPEPEPSEPELPGDTDPNPELARSGDGIKQVDGEATLGEVKEALKALHKAKGLAQARALLQRFGVERISELKEDKYASFVAMSNEAAAA